MTGSEALLIFLIVMIVLSLSMFAFGLGNDVY